MRALMSVLGTIISHGMIKDKKTFLKYKMKNQEACGTLLDPSAGSCRRESLLSLIARDAKSKLL